MNSRVTHLAGDIVLADAGTITTKVSAIGAAILAAAVVLAIVAAVFTTAQRRWVVVGTILLIGASGYMIVSDPVAILSALGGAIKRGVWDPILSSL